jgi:acid phosphatase type 7
MTRPLCLVFIVVLVAGCTKPPRAVGSSRLPKEMLVPAADSIAVVLAAGDIAACTRGAWSTARLLDSLPGDIIVPGDAAYVSKADPNPYRTCYDTTWGRHKQRTHPVPGNHDLDVGGMRRYKSYFGKSAGPGTDGYYSFDVGRWHVIALNSTIDTRSGSRQGKWLAADLAAHPSLCTLAFMHHPRFSSGPHEKSRSAVFAFRALDEAGVDVVVSAHDHVYERFAPMRENGQRDDARGVRQFIVGTGGNALYPFDGVAPNSEAQDNEDFGILKLTLSPRGYSWEFIPAARSDFRDAGSGACH